MLNWNLFRQPTDKEHIQSWSDILWREWQHCDDEDYQWRLFLVIKDKPIDKRILRQERPHALEIENALAQACQKAPKHLALWAELLQLLAEKRRHVGSVEQLLAELEDPEWVVRFLARHTLATVGDKAIIPLTQMARRVNSPPQPMALWLLASIEHETTQRLGKHAMKRLCPDCLAIVGAFTIKVSDEAAFTYFGCRVCGQSQDFLDVERVTAVLDRSWAEIKTFDGTELRVNWLHKRALFDFNRVEIVQATPEDIERFAVRVGNDTDLIRQPRHTSTICWIGPNCQLPPSSIRMLEQVFNCVELMVEN